MDADHNSDLGILKGFLKTFLDGWVVASRLDFGGDPDQDLDSGFF